MRRFAILVIMMAATVAAAGPVDDRWAIGVEGGVWKLVEGYWDHSNVDEFAGLSVRKGLSPHWSMELGLRIGSVRSGVEDPTQNAGWTFDHFTTLATEIYNPLLMMEYQFSPDSAIHAVPGPRRRRHELARDRHHRGSHVHARRDHGPGLRRRGRRVPQADRHERHHRGRTGRRMVDARVAEPAPRRPLQRPREQPPGQHRLEQLGPRGQPRVRGRQLRPVRGFPVAVVLVRQLRQRPRRYPQRRRRLPGSGRGLRRLRGPGRLPRSRQRR